MGSSRNCSNCGTSGDSCNCIVQAGSGITIDGTGNDGAPYIVTNNLQSQNSNCVALAGAGTTSSKLTATLTLDPNGGLICTPDGLAMKDECTEVMCLDDGTPVGYRRVDGDGDAEYFNSAGVSQGTTIPVGWGLCDCLGDGSGGSVVISDDDLIYVTGNNHISLNPNISRFVSTAIVPNAVNPNLVGIQSLSVASLSITNPSSVHQMNVMIICQMHNASWSMAGVGGTANNWTIYNPDSLQPLFGATSTTAGIESFSQGNCMFGGGMRLVAPGGSYTISLTQQFVVNTTSGSVSNQALHGYGALYLIGVVR